MHSIPGFEIKKLLHENDHYLIVRAEEPAHKRSVIVKFLNREHPSNQEITRFRHEYETISRFYGIEGIASVLNLKEHGSRMFMVFEDIEGGPFKEYIRDNQLSPRDFLYVAADMANTLHKIHSAGTVHRDINPSHYLYNPTFNRLCLIDLSNSAPLTREGVVLAGNDHTQGTIGYISPEQTGRMNRRVDWRTDLYSLGVTLYEMLTGRLPFDSTGVLEMIHAHIARRPVPPDELKPGIPHVVSSIIMKLLSKNAENRYQSAAGVRADLTECLERLERTGTIDKFPIALHDIPERFRLPSKIYGRDSEIQDLVSCFTRAVRGARKMVLVSGAPGIGKTSLVNEIQNVVIEKRGYFVSSKFDQFVRNTPYSAVIGAFRELVNQLLPEPDDILSRWRQKIRDTLGANGQIIVDLIPELELIIGRQPPVAALKPVESRNRFGIVFYNFMTLFCTREHPLLIFLDDLQWADIPSLALIETMMSIEDGAFMLVLAYRDNEVDEHHPLMGMLENIPERLIKRTRVGPLKPMDTAEIISDIVHQGPGDTELLSALVQKKTGGNPFFLGEFLKTLNAEGLLVYDAGRFAWHWDIAQINSRSFTNNVVELVVGKIKKLHSETQTFLRYASMLGSIFDLARVALLTGRPREDSARELDEALREDFIIGIGGGKFAFAHDRIQQGAYGMMKEAERPAEHLRAGRLLLAGIPEDKREDDLFVILDQYNKGKELITSGDEKIDVARLNHRAGLMARKSTAFDLAYKFLKAGVDLIHSNPWQDHYEFTLAIYSDAAEAAYLSGDHVHMQKIGEAILKNARSLVDRVPFYIINITALSSQARFREALDMGLDVLGRLGFRIPREPARIHIILAFMRAREKLRGKTPEEIAAFPELQDERLLAIMGLVDCLITVAFNSSPEILALLNFKSVYLLVKHRVSCRNSRMLLCMFGMVFLVSVRNKVETGHDIERLYLLLGSRPDAKADEAAMQFAMAFFYYHRVDNIRAALPYCLEAYRAGLEHGNFTYAGNGILVAAKNMLLSGEGLSESEKFISAYMSPLGRLRQDRALSSLRLNQQFILNLRGHSDDPCTLSGSAFREDETIPVYQKENDLGILYDIHFLKMILCYLFGNGDHALKCSLTAFGHIKTRNGSPSASFYYYYDSLINLAVYDQKNGNDRRAILGRIRRNRRFLLTWSKHAPMNYAHKIHLIDAELARVTGHIVAAADHYDQAVKLAGENQYINEQAIANELAGRFYLSLNKPKIARVYLAEARYLYERWGAAAKVRHMEAQYSKVIANAFSAGPRDIGHIDITSVMKASQAISGEIMLERLFRQLLHIIIENAGADRGFLIFKDDDRLMVRAGNDAGGIALYDNLPLDECDDLCAAVVRYSDRKKELLI